MASDEPMIVPETAITGASCCPEGTVMPEGAVWSVELQDTSLADVPAVTVGLDGGLIEDLTATRDPLHRRVRTDGHR